MEELNNNIEKIISSFDNASIAQSRLFMHTRVMARLDQKNGFYSFITRPSFVVIISFALVLLNLVAIYYNSSTNENEDITNLATNTNLYNYTDGNANNNFFLTATNNNY